MRVYLAYSLAQEAPWPPADLGYPYVLVSADEIADYGVERALEFFNKTVWPQPRLLVDSGGYRFISKGRLPQPSQVLEVQRSLWEDLQAYPVLLDVPVRNPLRASEADYKASNEATARNSRLWQRVFGDYYVYPLHAQDQRTLKQAIETLKKTHPTVATVGLGSLAPLAAKSPARVIRVVSLARELLEGKWLHVFGVGNGMLAALSHWGLADSADTASHLIDAKFGMARMPSDMAMKYVVARGPSRRRAAPQTIAKECRCPVCSTNPQAMAGWGRAGFRARAIHNAYWILKAVAEPSTGYRLISRRPQLAKILRRIEKKPAPLCIVSCGKRKRNKPVPAALLYTGVYFRAQIHAAWSRCGTRTLILSAKHGLLHPSSYVEPYEKKGDPGDTMLIELVRRQACRIGLQNEKLLIYAGKVYYEILSRSGVQDILRPHKPDKIGKLIKEMNKEAVSRLLPKPK